MEARLTFPVFTSFLLVGALLSYGQAGHLCSPRLLSFGADEVAQCIPPIAAYDQLLLLAAVAGVRSTRVEVNRHGQCYQLMEVVGGQHTQLWQSEGGRQAAGVGGE